MQTQMTVIQFLSLSQCFTIVWCFVWTVCVTSTKITENGEKLQIYHDHCSMKMSFYSIQFLL